MNDKLKILLCHNFYKEYGGEDGAVLALKALLEEKGHRVILFSEDNRQIDQYSTAEKIKFFPRAVFSRRTFCRLRHIAINDKPDIAHVHNVFPLVSPAAYIALHRSGIPIIQTIHNYRLMCINGIFLRDGRICENCKGGNFISGVRFKCYRDSYVLSALYALTIGGHRRVRTFQRIRRFIALSHFAAEKLSESGVAARSQISVLGNFLPSPLPEYGAPDLREPYICYIGRLSNEKGIFTLLEAMRRITTLRLKIMGTGPLQESMERYLRDHKLDHVEMLGFVAGEEKYRILRRALCCVVPSECYENFPFGILESAAVGTPLIVSRIGSLATLLSEGAGGWTYKTGDSDDLRLKLQDLVARPEVALRMGQAARMWVETTHTADAHYSTLMTIYRQVLS